MRDDAGAWYSLGMTRYDVHVTYTGNDRAAFRGYDDFDVAMTTAESLMRLPAALAVKIEKVQVEEVFVWYA